MSSYVGHIKQYFEKRIYQYKNDAKSHVKKHISNCPLFNQSFFDNYGYEFGTAFPKGLCGNAETDFMKSHFAILEKNLHN